ncbi:hypothetical protein HDU87_000591 [Geranomyces variabilis]|uniref:Uncharacterized protein n=1 Tax=Geranomyces variabilis TaxID=109894 RepID=A0AAD5TEG5_9FUNG|nr:hypothetical protein HDU87_000591 [Geranomyces variabilis]
MQKQTPEMMDKRSDEMTEGPGAAPAMNVKDGAEEHLRLWCVSRKGLVKDAMAMQRSTIISNSFFLDNVGDHAVGYSIYRQHMKLSLLKVDFGLENTARNGFNMPLSNWRN